MTKEDLIIYAKTYLKPLGFKKKNNRWLKTEEDFTLCFYIQGSRWNKNDYYIRPGIFINSLLPSELIYGHFITEIKQTTPRTSYGRFFKIL